MNDTIVKDENTLPFAAPVADEELEAMMRAGVHLGHAKTKDHPSMKRHIFGVRNTISVLDLTATKEALARAEALLKEIGARGGSVLLVGTRPAARKIILEIAERTQMPYYIERWIGGTLTNFKVIGKRVEHMEQLEREKAGGELEKYTKKERMKKEEELVRLRKMFDGLHTMKRLPDAVFIVDTIHDDTAVREGRRMKIPLIALCDTNANVELIDYPIPSNDDALPAVRYMVGRIGAAIEEGQKVSKGGDNEQQSDNDLHTAN